MFILEICLMTHKHFTNNVYILLKIIKTIFPKYKHCYIQDTQEQEIFSRSFQDLNNNVLKIYNVK